MKNPNEKYFKFLGVKTIDRVIKNDLTGEKVGVRVKTFLQRVVKKSFFGKKKTYLRVVNTVYYEDKVDTIIKDYEI